MSPSPEDAREALLARARTDPEQPFLFFRSARGTFTWWSFARAAEALRASAPSDADAGAPSELLAAVRDASDSELGGARALAAAVESAGGRAGEREIWISARPLERPEERLLALTATLAGWAVVREPGESLTPALLLWARPTLLSGSEAELLSLLAGVAAEAPRWRRARWLARRLDRLRTLLVERGGSPEAVARALAATGVELARSPRVLSFPGSGW